MCWLNGVSALSCWQGIHDAQDVRPNGCDTGVSLLFRVAHRLRSRQQHRRGLCCQHRCCKPSPVLDVWVVGVIGGHSKGGIGDKSLCNISKILVTSGGRIGIIKPRDDATTLGDVGGDEMSCDGGNKSWACTRMR